MTKLHFRIEPAAVSGMVDAAIIPDGDDPTEALEQAVWNDLATDIMVTVSGVTMFLAAWQDPDHWSTDWRERATEEGDVEGDEFDANEYVAGLLAAATEAA